MKKTLSFAVILIAILSIVVVASARGGVQKTQTGTVTGQLIIKGVGPMFGATVLFFNKKSGPPPSPAHYWRVPTHVFTVDENVQFKAELPIGEYYMGAIDRSGGDVNSPPREGEYFLIKQDAKGKPRTIIVRNKRTIKLGVIAEASPFSRSSLAEAGITAVEGTIRNDKGDPVEGILVLAYASKASSSRPLFASERSDKAGKYQLRLSGGGKYYLRALANVGGPEAEHVTEVYKGVEAVTVQSGSITKDKDIIVTSVDAQKPRS
jgi:hypothetical protein